MAQCTPHGIHENMTIWVSFLPLEYSQGTRNIASHAATEYGGCSCHAWQFVAWLLLLLAGLNTSHLPCPK
jgi:hypothetical protein